MVPISLLSTRTNVSVRAIRHYTNIGLLKAIEANVAHRRRIYEESAVERVIIIRMARELGMNLSQIGCILNTQLVDIVDFKLDPNVSNKSKLVNDLIIKKKNISFILEYVSQNDSDD